MNKGHRKTIKHFHEPGHLHELTFSCYQRRPLLTKDLWLKMLAHSIDQASERHHFSLIAFVFMPEHVHLLVLPARNASSISAFLKALKRPFSFRIKKLLEQADSPLLNHLTIPQRPGVSTFRFWQEGPGYDRNIAEPGTIETSINYIHNNPVKRKLCTRAIDWKWSSARKFVHSELVAYQDLPKMTPLPPEYSLSN